VVAEVVAALQLLDVLLVTASPTICELRASTGTRNGYEVFDKPRYDLLATVIEPAELEPILQVWREVIAADPQACGFWGPPGTPA
jgi:hypothetical protein